MTFRGSYDYAIDDRGRVPLPPRYRDAFREGVILVQGREGCVEVYTVRDYEEEAKLYTSEAASKLSGRRLRRGFFARSWDGDLDRQGRLLVPRPFRQWADVDGQVVMAGRGECLEIWSGERWQAELEAVSNEDYEDELESGEPAV